MGAIKRQSGFPEPKTVNPETRGPGFVISMPVLMFLTLAIVCGRLYARQKVVGRFGVDDYMIIAAVLFAIPTTVILCIAVNDYGLDRHTWDQRIERAVTQQILIFVGQLLFYAAGGLAKLSVLLFYRRVMTSTSNKAFHTVNWIAIFVVSAMSIALIVAATCVCQPVDALWLQYRFSPPYTEKYTCRDPASVYWAGTIFNLCADIAITLIPLLFIKNLQITRKKKWGLAAIFGLGISATIASALRIYYMDVAYNRSTDVAWYAMALFACVLVEINVAIICASAAALKPLISKSVSSYSSGSSGASSGRIIRTRPHKSINSISVLRPKTDASMQEDVVELKSAGADSAGDNRSDPALHERANSYDNKDHVVLNFYTPS